MKFLRYNPINSQNSNNTITTAAIDMNQIIKLSGQVVMGAGSGSQGSLQLQVSNDQVNGPFQDTTFVNWSNLGGAATVTAASNTLIAEQDMCYRALRAVFTSTATGSQTVTALADTGSRQSSTIQPVADVAGSLNNKYFFISSVNPYQTQKNFYVWFDNGGGVDPAVPGKTGVHIVYTNGATAATLGGLIATALAALSSDFASATGTTTVTVMNAVFGPVTQVADGTAPTGFAFATPIPGVNSNLVGTHFFVSDANSAHKYYILMAPDSVIVTPSDVAGYTQKLAGYTSGASAAVVGSAIGAVTATGLTISNIGAVSTFTNTSAGPFVPAFDSVINPTGFAFAVTGPTANVSLQLMGLGV